MNDIARIERDGLSINPDTPPEAIADVLGALDAIKRRVREAERVIKDRLLEVIRETGRDIVVGSTRYYAGNPLDKRSDDTRATLLALLETAGGDVDAVAGCLVAQPFKAGACEAVLGAERFAGLFTVTRKAELREGKPVKQIMSVDERFNTKGGR